MKFRLKVMLLSQLAILPTYATPGSAGMDVTSIEEVEIGPGQRALVKTGLALEIPVGFEVQVRPRSGLALKQGLTVLNSPGTIDSDYRGEVGVILLNTSNEAQRIKVGDRIAQLVMAPVISKGDVDIVHATTLTETERGEGGFGSTGRA